MSRLSLTALLLTIGWASSSPASTLQSGEIIPTGRRIEWAGRAGVPGGIPNRATIHATLNPGATAAQINQAIQNCPADQVVFLSAGTYPLSAPINFNGKSRMTLRGAGPGKTILKPDSSLGMAINSGETAWFGTVRTITGGSTKGSTSITVNDASGIQAGTMLNLYQDADPAFYWTRSPQYRQDHTGQFVMVKAVSGNTLQLEDPLVWGFNLNPRLKPEVQPGMRWCGIEGLTLTADSSFGGWFIIFWNAYACWVKDVETAWGNGDSHLRWSSCLRSELRDSYLHDTHSTTDGYGLVTAAGWSGDRAGCTGTLVENNIFSGLRSAIIPETEVGSVLAYNYFRNTRFTGWPNYQIADVADHAAHQLMNLVEGNVGVGFQIDGYHGSSSHYTFFRNWFSGQHAEANRTGNVKTVDLGRFGRYSNVVGNVLGFPGWPRTTTGRYEMSGMPGYTEQTVIYRLGYPNPGNNAYSTTNPPTDGENGGLDPQTRSTLLRWGNFDYQNNATRWVAGEVPSGVPVPTTQTLPASLFYASRPGWWPANIAWPPMGPDISGGQNADGRVHKIPAQVRYEGGTIVPPPTLPVVTVSASDASAGESANPGTFTITRTGSTTSALTVNFSVGGTATSGTDYAALGTSVTIPAGSAAATKTVTPVDDTAVEGNETVVLTLSANAAYTAGSPSSATVTIADNDSPPPLPTVTISATDASASEPGTDSGQFTVTRSGSTSGSLAVSYAISGTAGNGTDYTTLGTTVTIPSGSASATVTVTPKDDTLVEGSETVTLTLSSSGLYTVGSPSSASVTIADNDSAPPPDQPPVVTLTNPAGGATLAGSIPAVARAHDPDVGTTDGAGISRVVFELRQGTTVLTSRTDTAAPYDWLLDTTSRPDGAYTLRATATSVQGASTWTEHLVSILNGTPGTGLSGYYYDAVNFTGLAFRRTDATVNFDWGTGSPSPAMGADTFSVRWVGYVVPEASETYTFTTLSNDGVRLWVNGELLVDRWVDQAATEWNGSIALEAGRKATIVMEYYENGTQAVARLSWSSLSTPKEVIPQDRLTPATEEEATRDRDGDGIVDFKDEDRDGDGVSNVIEIAAGSDPDDSRSVPKAGAGGGDPGRRGCGATGLEMILVIGLLSLLRRQKA